MTRGSRLAVVIVALGSVPHAAHAQEAMSAPRGLERWRIGFQAGLLDLPRGHMGVPFDSTMEGYHLPVEIVVRWQWSRKTALDAGVGLPHGAGGVTAWLGHELGATIARDRRGRAALTVYEDAGVSLGFVGPDYYARHHDVFVGYLYGVGGPVGFGVRLPIGLCVSWLDGAFDTYVEATSTLLVVPSVDTLFDVGLGIRVRL